MKGLISMKEKDNNADAGEDRKEKKEEEEEGREVN